MNSRYQSWLPCRFSLKTRHTFSTPPVRTNTALHAVRLSALGFAMLVWSLLGSARHAAAAPGDITTYAGTSQGYGGDGGPASAAQLNSPSDVDFCRADDSGCLTGEMLIADTGNHRVRVVSSGGTITSIIGTGVPGFSGDGGAQELCQLNAPRAVLSGYGLGIYVADSLNGRVRQTESFTAATGIINTVATGVEPVDLIDVSNITFSDPPAHQIKRQASVYAGTGVAGFSGDDGPATAAQLNNPTGLAADTDEASVNNYIADTGNHRIRRVSEVTDTITTVAGTGTPGANGDGGLGTAAQLNAPQGVAVSSDGDLYIADTGNHRVRRIDKITGRIDTVAGTTQGLSGDNGPAISAQLDGPTGLAFDSGGNLYIVDKGNHRIRRVEAPIPDPTPPPAAPAQLLTGKKLVIKNPSAGPAANKLVHLAKDASIAIGAAGSDGDPQCTGAGGGGTSSIRIASSGGAGDVTIALPCANWTTNGPNTMYKYKDTSGATCKVVSVKNGNLLKAVCGGVQVGIDLAAGTAPVAIELIVNSERYCTSFGGLVKKDGSDGKGFLAKDALAPASCPGAATVVPACSNAPLGNCGSCGIGGNGGNCLDHADPDLPDNVCVSLGTCSGSCSDDSGCASGYVCATSFFSNECCLACP